MRSQSGYSLLELSFVLVITGLMAGASMMLGVAQIENARRKNTEQKMDTIETALMTFRGANNRLPCPTSYTQAQSSSSFGVESSTPGTCTGAPFGPEEDVVEGGVPVRTLSLPDDFAYDGWGRKFGYAVDRRMTASNVFPNYPTNQRCGHITVEDQSGEVRSDGAIYALISFGTNGHGAYLQTSQRTNASSSNADEQQNCHCNSSATATAYDPLYIQRNTQLESTTASNVFDDIVRYKERWQLASIDDNVTANDTYYGPELIIGSSSSAYLHPYEISCDSLSILTRPATLPSGAVNAISFTRDNQYVGVASGGITPFATIYKRAGMTLSALASQPDIQPTSAANALAFSSNTQFLAVGATLTPYLYLYRRTGDTFAKLDNVDTLPGAAVLGVAFSPNSIHLVETQAKASSKLMRIYKYDSQNYSYLSSQPDSQPAGNNAYGPSFSYDSVYLAIGSDATPYITFYHRYLDDFTKLSSPASLPTGTVYQTAWSPDAKYVAAAHANSPFLTIYKHSGLSFTKLSNPADLPPSTAYGVSFSRNGTYLAVSHAITPYVTVYRRIGDTFTKLTNPTTLPGSTGLVAAFRAP